MSKRVFALGAMATALVLVVAGAFASNMGFKLNYRLAAQGETLPEGGTSFNGTNTLGLPFNRQSGLNTAQDLYNDIGSANVQNIQRYIQSTNKLDTYSGSGTGFNLETAEGYFVRMSVGTDYIVVGSHDPAFVVDLEGEGEPVPGGGTSANGTNFYAYPYHSTASNAQELIDEIGSTNVSNVQRYVRSNNKVETCAPGCASPFPLKPGEAYFIRIQPGVTVPYTPSHY